MGLGFRGLLVSHRDEGGFASETLTECRFQGFGFAASGFVGLEAFNYSKLSIPNFLAQGLGLGLRVCNPNAPSDAKPEVQKLKGSPKPSKQEISKHPKPSFAGFRVLGMLEALFTVSNFAGILESHSVSIGTTYTLPL